MSSTNEKSEKGETKELKLKGGFSFGFNTVVGGIFALIVIFIVVPTIAKWAADAISKKYDSGYPPAYYSSNSNADNVPPGFRVIRE